jgi:hypothetical protein
LLLGFFLFCGLHKTLSTNEKQPCLQKEKKKKAGPPRKKSILRGETEKKKKKEREREGQQQQQLKKKKTGIEPWTIFLFLLRPPRCFLFFW